MIKYLKEGLILNLPVLSDSLQLSSSKFEVTKVLDGGMGTCVQIKACDDSVYALKMIHPDLFVEEDSMQRYIEELKKWLTLSACNGIVEALMIVRVNEIPCIVSRWMKGGDLTPHVRIINKEIFYKTIDRIATTLKWAYEKHHIIHRDLKPQNILMDESFNAYIGDWGLAKDLSQAIEEKNGTIVKKASPTQTVDGTFMGTVAYAAPEQILGKKDIDFRADIYSLGCIMYQWETGRLPFDGKTFEEVATKQIYQLPDKISGFFGTTKFKVEPIIIKCLKKNPADRYQSYDDFLKDFRKAASKNSDFTPFEVKERYRTARIGEDEFDNKVKNNEFNMVRGNAGHILMEREDILPYLKEAQALSDINEYEKAISILKRFYNRNMFVQCPDDPFVQSISINLGWAYLQLRKEDEALYCFSTLDNAESKPKTYFANIASCYINKLQFDKVKDISLEGLKYFPQDPDIQGNLTIAYTELGMLDDAMISAQKRLKMGRDLHSLIEAAGICFQLGAKYVNTDLPLSLNNDVTALKLYREAEQLNPKHLDTKRNIANTLFYLNRYADSMQKIVDVTNLQHGSSAYEVWIMARNYLFVGSFKEAYELCNKFVPSFPNYIPIQRVRAQAMVDGFVIDHYNDGNRIIETSSLQFFQNIVKDIKNRKPSDFKFLARYYIWMSKDNPQFMEEAFRILEEGKKLYPNDWRFDFFLASYYNLFKTPQQALPYAIEAIRKGPWREKTYQVCAQIYKRLGNINQAASMEQKAKDIQEQKSKLYKDAKAI